MGNKIPDVKFAAIRLRLLIPAIRGENLRRRIVSEHIFAVDCVELTCKLTLRAILTGRF